MKWRNRLITGDSLTLLKDMPDAVVDVGVTSPPYNKQEKQKGWLVRNVLYASSSDAVPEPEYQQHQIEVLNEIYRITKPGGAFFYNHKIRWVCGEMFHPMDWLRKTNWTIRQEIIWDRVIAANIRGWRFWQVDERIYWLYKPIAGRLIGAELASGDAKMTSVWRNVPETKNPHPAPFPLWMPARIIISILGKARDGKSGMVLDPYVGSGTTAVAARLLGHDYVGFDKSPDYIDCACKRIAHVENEAVKVREELALHEVGTSFTERKAARMNVGKFRKNAEGKSLGWPGRDVSQPVEVRLLPDEGTPLFPNNETERHDGV